MRLVFSFLVVSVMLSPAPPEHPHVKTVLEYREARRNSDVEALQSLLSDDSRIWFGEKSGPGVKREMGGGGPWSDWDHFFRSESTVSDFQAAGNELRTTVSETNDWYRLVGRSPSRYYITYYFDDGGRIEGTLIHSIPGEPKKSDRLAEFEAWARERHPGLLERLMPDGRIDPALDNARLWKTRLMEWLEAAGLGNPLAD